MPLRLEKTIVATCCRCEHQWRPVKMESPDDEENIPKWCPNCNSPYWNRPITKPGTSRAMRDKNGNRKK